MFCFFIFVCLYLTEWYLGWWFYFTLIICAPLAFFSFMLSGLGGWYLLMALIGFLGFGLGEAWEESEEGSRVYALLFPSSQPQSLPPLLPDWLRLCSSVFPFHTEGCQWLPVQGPGCLTILWWSLTPVPSLVNSPSSHTLFSHLTYHRHISRSLFISLICCLQQLNFVNVCLFCLLCLILIILLNVSEILVLEMSFLNSI